MDFHLLAIFVLLYFVAASDASSTDEEMYWKSMLPSTPLPIPLKPLLYPPESEISFSFEESYAQQTGSRSTYGVGYWPHQQKLNSNSLLNSTTVYFLRDKLQSKEKMRIVFTKSSKGSNFLPCRVAKSLPFSSENLPEILNHFAMQPASEKARVIKQTIEECKEPNIEGEDKHCSTCLESMVDFVVSKLGTRVRTVFNEVEQGEEDKEQEYTVLKGVKVGENQIVCHKQRYPFAVFYCHSVDATEVYEVPLMGANGSKAKVVVLCHTDTSAWTPDHFAFQVLPNVKPGGPPICHLVNSDTIVWLPN